MGPSLKGKDQICMEKAGLLDTGVLRAPSRYVHGQELRVGGACHRRGAQGVGPAGGPQEWPRAGRDSQGLGAPSPVTSWSLNSSRHRDWKIHDITF